MRTRMKVCCIANVDEARLAVACGADALGVVGAMPSGPGVIDDDEARAIAAWAPPPVATFLLTSFSGATDIAAHVRSIGAPVVQLVRHLEPRESARLAELLPDVRRVQVVHVEGDDALSRIPAYAPHVHAFLLDSGRPSLAVPQLGGTGRIHDWSVSAAFVAASPVPVFLAGGLHAGNVAAAIETWRQARMSPPYPT